MNNNRVMNEFVECFCCTTGNACCFIEESYKDMSKKDLADIITAFLYSLPFICIPEKEFNNEMKNVKTESDLYYNDHVTSAVDFIAEMLSMN